jgi:hypothetical protein
MIIVKYLSTWTFDISEQTIATLSNVLTRDERMQLFQELCEAMDKRVPERIWLATGIRKTDIYRYFPKSKSKKGGLAPNPITTVKIIKALIKKRRYELVAKILENAAQRVHSSCRECFDWNSKLREKNIIYNPLSESEINKIERSLPGLIKKDFEY